MASKSLHQRLLQDIAELQTAPYPNISLFVHDRELTKACLVLNVEAYEKRMHLTVELPLTYPLQPPRIHMNSKVQHPNIFGGYICASILNTQEGYTSAYTLKSIAIQLLSFFSSDTVTQSGGGYSINLASYREMQKSRIDDYTCEKCNFGRQAKDIKQSSLDTKTINSSPACYNKPSIFNTSVGTASKCHIVDAKIPTEVLLIILDYLETQELLIFAKAWDRIGKIITQYDILRRHELQCFCLKQDFNQVILGVGINVSRNGKQGKLSSEFDLLSREGFHTHGIRQSVQGLTFTNWLPLPISNRHWHKASALVNKSLSTLSNDARMSHLAPIQVIYSFMNDIVVDLNSEAEKLSERGYSASGREVIQRTLTTVSEKAIESYYHLFHLLLCLATSNPSIIQSANLALREFKNGMRSKRDVPSLGLLLVACLISDEEVGEVIPGLIKEAITRNVVWMLDKVAPELAYLEPSQLSPYRLKKTFEASKTSYRLFMFLNMFGRIALKGEPGLSGHVRLVALRDEAFKRYGAPPRGSAKELADAIKEIHLVDNFVSFLHRMEVNPMPSQADFTGLLKRCIIDSMEKGYSRPAYSQAELLTMRLRVEPHVERGKLVAAPVIGRNSFFPGLGGRMRTS